MSLAETARAYEVFDGFVRRAHSIARSKGWWDDSFVFETPLNGSLPTPWDRAYAKLQMTPVSAAVKIALVHSEVSEALECVRDGDIAERRADNGKPEGLPSELADIVIRVADLCGAYGIDLGRVIAEKMAYNEMREHRHGGKLL